MPALFERAIGGDWDDLHPRLRDRYGLVADDDRVAVGCGEMAAIRRSRLALPVLWLGTLDDFLFPEDGRNVSFTITSRAFRDAADREALHLRREFGTTPGRTFVDTLRWNPARDCLTDFFGHRGLLAADLHLGVESGDLTLEIGDQWLRVGGRYVRLPRRLSVEGTLRDGYDEDANSYHVAASVTNPVAGTVFEYQGEFAHETRPVESTSTDEFPLAGVSLPGESG